MYSWHLNFYFLVQMFHLFFSCTEYKCYIVHITLSNFFFYFWVNVLIDTCALQLCSCAKLGWNCFNSYALSLVGKNEWYVEGYACGIYVVVHVAYYVESILLSPLRINFVTSTMLLFMSTYHLQWMINKCAIFFINLLLWFLL